MNIVVMRHGEAQAHSRDGDAARTLTDRGMQQAQRAGRCLRECGVVPDEIWFSPYRRALQTAELVLESLNTVCSRSCEALVPEADPAQVLHIISRCAVDTLLLVSHQPLVSHLLSRLSGLDRFTIPVLAPASMVLLQAPEALPGCFEIHWQRHSPDFAAVS